MRRIIVACDGTGQSSTRGGEAVSTNVNRLCHALENATAPQQIVFYQSGVGTGSLGKVYTAVTGATGLGLDDNVLDAYAFIMNNYQPGDEVFLFGFSRGAFTARILAGLIIRLGIFDKAWAWRLKRAYEAYEKGDDAFRKYVAELEESVERDKKYGRPPTTRKVKVKVLACWDTVGSVGAPDYDILKKTGLRDAFEFYDPKLHYGIENAFHALALDEYRHPFSPTLYFKPDANEDNFLHRCDEKKINIEQCWFPGVHTNVGGGYADQYLADLTFAWMVDKCSPFLDFDWTVNIPMRLRLHHRPSDVHSAIRTKQAKEEKGEAGGQDKLIQVYPGYALGQLYDSFHNGIMPLLWWKVRTPGEYIAGDAKADERIHRSVRERWQNFKDAKGKPWRPDSLKGFELRLVHREGESERWQWVRPGKPATWLSSEVKEVVIEEQDLSREPSSFEWRLWDHEGYIKEWEEREERKKSAGKVSDAPSTH